MPAVEEGGVVPVKGTHPHYESQDAQPSIKVEQIALPPSYLCHQEREEQCPAEGTHPHYESQVAKPPGHWSSVGFCPEQQHP